MRTRKRIKLAQTGHDLLKKKQDSLMIEFFKLLKEIQEHRSELQEHYDRAVAHMNQARALESDIRIRAAALCISESSPVELSVKNIAGVRVPEIAKITQKRDHPLYDTLLLQDVGTAYDGIVDDVLTIAAQETALTRILDEIKKTKRRAHALEHILIPQLREAVGHVQFVLEEHEREEFARLKRMKH